MNALFAEHVSRIPALFADLCAKEAVDFPGLAPASPGVYVFLERGVPERIGRSGNLKKRLQGHVRRDHSSAAYAFKRARTRFGSVATYRKGSGRKELQRDPNFLPLFVEEIQRLKELQVKWIVVENDVDQYLLELYAAMEFELALDEFGNH